MPVIDQHLTWRKVEERLATEAYDGASRGGRQLSQLR